MLRSTVLSAKRDLHMQDGVLHLKPISTPCGWPDVINIAQKLRLRISFVCRAGGQVKSKDHRLHGARATSARVQRR